MTRAIRLFVFVLAVFFLNMAEAGALTLHRGINTSNWLANAMRQEMDERDFKEIARVGFDHIRLPVNPEMYGYPLRSNNKPTDFKFKDLDSAIALAAKYKLAVILDIHPGEEFMRTLENESWAEALFIDFWVEIAKHYKDESADTLVFELLNEPQYYGREDRYNALMKKLVTAIRSVDGGKRTLIIGAPQGSSLDGLMELETVQDSNIIYAFHFYEPYMVTHQGIHMGFDDRQLRYFRGVPYPSYKATRDARQYAPTARDALQARNELEDYREERWDASRISERMKVAADWARKHSARLICTEYGVLRNHIDANSRYAWINDARQAMDANNIAWSLWDYADLFGIVSMEGATSTDPVDGSVRFNDFAKGTRTIEPAAIKALALTAKASTAAPAATLAPASQLQSIAPAAGTQPPSATEAGEPSDGLNNNPGNDSDDRSQPAYHGHGHDHNSRWHKKYHRWKSSKPVTYH